MSETVERNRLRDLIESLCLIKGSFTLSTGAKSNFYFDCKRAMLDGEALSLIADAFLEEIDTLPESPKAIGGLTMGADFVVAAVIQRAYQTGRGITKGSVVRKEPKQHGTMNRVENELEPGTQILVVDDVVTTGKSTEKACDELLRENYAVVGIMCLVDREAGGIENLEKKYNVPVRSIFKKSDFPKLNQLENQVDEKLAVGA